MTTLVLRGEPKTLDVVWRPVVRALLVTSALLVSAWMIWQSMWLWLPLPLASALLLHEIVFWIRGDRAMTVSLTGHELTAVDPKRKHQLAVDLSQVHVARAGIRRHEGSHTDAFIALYDRERVILAARFRTGLSTWPGETTDLKALQAVLGGSAGIVRGLAPADRMVRQTLDDADGTFVAALIRAVPTEAWQRVAIRGWRGQAPPLDFMGLHQGPPDVLLTLDGDAWTLADRFSGETRSGTLHATTGGRSSRTLELLDTPGAAGQLARLPLLVWNLDDDLQVAVPAPIAGHLGDEVDVSDRTLHTHLAEGANLVWWLLDRLPARAVPPGLLQAISDSRVVLPHPPTILRRHMGGGLGPQS